MPLKAFFVLLISVIWLPLESQASRFARPGSDDNFRAETLESEDEGYDDPETFIPPPSAPPGGFSRFNRGGLDNGSDSSEDRDDQEFRPNFGGGTGPGNARFGSTSEKVEFKLVPPTDEDHPKNPRATSYEMYKSYSSYKRSLR